MWTLLRLLLLESLLYAASIATGNGTTADLRDFDIHSQDCTSSPIYDRRELEQLTVNSDFQCILACLEDVTCVEAVLTSQPGTQAKECRLLAYQDGGATVNTTNGCTLFTMASCQNNGQYKKGICECPNNFKGMYCELPNEDQCSEVHQRVHKVDPSSLPMYDPDGRDTLVTFDSQRVKVNVVDGILSGYSSYVKNTFQESNIYQNLWRTQLLDHIRLEAMGSELAFRTPMKLVEHYLTHEGGHSSVEYDADYGNQVYSSFSKAFSVFLRPAAGYVAMNSTFGSYRDVIKSLQEGHELVSSPPVAWFDPSRDAVVVQGVKTSLTASSSNIARPINVVSLAYDVGNDKSVEVFTDIANVNSEFIVPGHRVPTCVFDPCWYRATRDMKRGSGPSTAHLRLALRQGHRVRVVYEGMSSQVKVVHAVRDAVIFQIEPYPSPKDEADFQNHYDVVRTMVSSSGRIRSCLHKLASSAAVSHEDYVIGSDDIDWFVDSRPWRLAYVTTMAGDWKSGNYSELKDAVTQGADVHIMLHFVDSVESYMLADAVHVGQNSITAEVNSVLRGSLTDEDFRWSSMDKCSLSSYLIDTHRGVKLLAYTLGPSPTELAAHLGPSGGVVSWFISL